MIFFAPKIFKYLQVSLFWPKHKSNSLNIFFEKKEIGKILIKNDFPFAIIKYRDKDFDFENQYICGDATIKIIKPNWIN